MVYKKYIKRGGKVFGPYYYESYRDKNGRVKTRFISGPGKKDKLADIMKKRKLLIYLLGIFFILFWLVFFAIQIDFQDVVNDVYTGRVVTDPYNDFKCDFFCYHSSNCLNLEEGLYAGDITGEDYNVILEECGELGYSECGYEKYSCFEINGNLNCVASDEFYSCNLEIPDSGENPEPEEDSPPSFEVTPEDNEVNQPDSVDSKTTEEIRTNQIIERVSSYSCEGVEWSSCNIFNLRNILWEKSPRNYIGVQSRECTRDGNHIFEKQNCYAGISESSALKDDSGILKLYDENGNLIADLKTSDNKLDIVYYFLS